MLSKINRYLKPDLYCASLDDLDFNAFYKNGYHLILIDVDNTLAYHGAHQADDYAHRAISRANEAGLSCYILSNARPERIKSYASTLKIPFVASAKKPSTKAMMEICRSAGVKPEQVVIIGDQILTDVICARRAGCLAVLVQPRNRQEAFHVRMKRLVEKGVKKHYRLKIDRPARTNQEKLNPKSEQTDRHT